MSVTVSTILKVQDVEDVNQDMFRKNGDQEQQLTSLNAKVCCFYSQALLYNTILLQHKFEPISKQAEYVLRCL